MRVAIVIVNYRTAELASECLVSLDPVLGGHPDWSVMVVDNASGDDSPAVLERTIRGLSCGDRVQLRLADRNGGFAAGNNVAFRIGLSARPCPDAFLMLNPDTVVREEAIAPLVDRMASDPDIGIVGGSVFGEDGVPQCSAFRFPSPLGELESAARLGSLSRLLAAWRVAMPPSRLPHRCDWVSGAYMLVRREILAEIGLMDEEYFLYFEEVDLALKAKRAGWETWHVPDGGIVHREGSATGIRRAGERRKAWWYASRRRFLSRAHGTAGLMLADALWAAGRASLVARRVLRLGGSTAGDPRWFAWDLLGGDLRALLRGDASGTGGRKQRTVR